MCSGVEPPGSFTEQNSPNPSSNSRLSMLRTLRPARRCICEFGQADLMEMVSAKLPARCRAVDPSCGLAVPYWSSHTSHHASLTMSRCLRRVLDFVGNVAVQPGMLTDPSGSRRGCRGPTWRRPTIGRSSDDISVIASEKGRAKGVLDMARRLWDRRNGELLPERNTRLSNFEAANSVRQ